MARTEDRIVQIARKALSDGPVSMAELRLALDQAGLKYVDDSDVWQALHLHGIADLEGSTWLPRGWMPPVPTQALATHSRTSDTAPRPTPQQPAVGSSEPLPRLTPRAEQRVRAIKAAIGLPETERQDPSGPLPDNWLSVTREAIQALDHELLAVTRKRTETDVRLIEPQFIVRGNARDLYRFEAQSEVPASEGSNCILIPTHDPHNVDVEIVSIFGSVITLALPPGTDPGATATLRCDLSWLLHRQKERLRELQGGAPGFNGVAAVALVSADRTPSSSLIERVPISGLNNGQQLAIARAEQAGLSWLWGPPGTGKTTTVAALVEHLMAQGQRILLVTPTNVATDVATMALLRRLPSFAEGSIVRVGQPADPALLDRRGGQVLVDQIAAKRGEPIARRLVDIQSEILRTRDELNKLKAVAKANRHLTAQQADQRIRLEHVIAELQAEQEALNLLLRQVRREVCRDASVVTSTVHQVILNVLKGISFDVVIIDEASMMSSSLAMLAAGAGQGHTVVAGDFRQLPPVAIGESAEVHAWLKRSPFEACGVSSRVLRGDIPGSLSALSVQHRMKPGIADAVSKAFYPENPLRTPDTVSARVRSANVLRLLPDADIVAIDSSSLKGRTARRGGLSSRYNIRHAQVLAGLITQRSLRSGSLGVVSPFSPQARLLEALLEDEVTDIRASTVHRFQGAEADVVVYDAPDAPLGVDKLHPWFRDGEAGGDGARLLNVAIGRAREHLVFIGDLDHLHRSRGQRDAIESVLDRIDRFGTHMPWQDVISLPGSPTALTDNALAEMAAALRGTDEAVVIFTPRVDGLPPSFYRALNDAAERIPVTLWFDAGPSGDLPDGLVRPTSSGRNRLSDGVNDAVLLRPLARTLESFAIIDHTIWSASGALLSPAAGHVLRTRHAGLADALRRVSKRRSTDRNPGTGEPAETCGTCDRLLVRSETSYRLSTRSVCLNCSPARRR